VFRLHGGGTIPNKNRGHEDTGESPESLYRPAKVDRVLHDGDQVQLGGCVLTGHLTAGHTKGCTTWTMKVSEAGKSYDA
jgi:metallo-beta-lactamase class B